MSSVVGAVAWRHPLQHRETASGFASRLAALNGRRLGGFLRDMGIHPRHIDKGDEKAVRTLAAIGGADPGALVQYTAVPAPDKKFQILAGEKFDRLSVLRTYFRYCPHCIAEDMARFEGPLHSRPWLRVEWTIDFVRACPVHNTLLLSTTPPRRQFESPDFCEAMEDLLPQIKRQTTSSISMPHSPLRDWIIDRLDGKAQTDWLSTMHMYVVAGFSQALGLSSLHPPKVRTASLSEMQWAEAADEGFRILQGGKTELTALLERLNEGQRVTRGVIGLRDTYGYAYGLLQKTVEDPNFATLRDIVREVAINTLPLEAGTDVLGKVLDKPRVYSIRTASKVSGAHALTIRNLFVRKDLTDAREASGLMDHRVLVKAEEIEAVIEGLKEGMSTPEVQRVTGIPRMHLKALIAEGYLPTVTDSTEKAYAKHRFTQGAVDAMLSKVFEGAVPVQSAGERQMSIGDARHVAGAEIEMVLSYIFEGKLAWKGLIDGKRDYSSVLLDVDEVIGLVRSGPERCGLTRAEMVKFMPGLTTSAVARLVEDGHLATAEEYSKEARRMVPMITRESAEAFKAAYVTLGELCQVSGLHHKQVVSILTANNIPRITMIPNVYCYLYSRQSSSIAFPHV